MYLCNVGMNSMLNWRPFLVTALLAGSLAACANPPKQSGNATNSNYISTTTTNGDSRLDAVKERGTLICGVDGNMPGFSFVDEDGEYSGIDVDICKAVAAAVLGDAEAVEYRKLDSTERFTAMAGGEVDMLSRNTAWTITRDTAVGMEFAPTIFYNGQGIMVRADSGIATVKDLDGKSICVEAGTPMELNLIKKINEVGVDLEVKAYQQIGTTAYDEGVCDAITANKSWLLKQYTTLSNPDAHVLLDITISKDPLGPVTVNNDSAWFDVVKWVTYGLIEAEELGITSENLSEMEASNDPTIRRFLGAEGELGEYIGLEPDFMAKAIAAVGNYGEIYDRNLGENSEFKLDRGLNALWTDGGLLYAPPFR